MIGGRADALQTYLKDRLPAVSPTLSQALLLSYAALQEGGNSQRLSPEGIEAAVLDRTRSGRKFRRLSAPDIRQMLTA